MTTVVRTLATTFTNPTTLPVAVQSTATHRWRAADVPGADGATVQTWNAAAGGVALTQPNTVGERPLLKIENGVQMLRFDGTDDWMQPTSVTLDPANLHTVTVVARVRAAAGTGEGILNTSTGAIQRGTITDEITNMLVALGGGTGANNSAIAVDPTSTAQFHVISLALGLDQTSTPVRSVTIDGTSATLDGDATPQTIRPGFGYSGLFGNIDILEIVTWPFALTTTQRAAVRAQMQADYPGLIA